MNASTTSPPLPIISKRLGIPLPQPTKTGAPIKILESTYEDLVRTTPVSREIGVSGTALALSSIKGFTPLRLRWRRILRKMKLLFRQKEKFSL